MKKNIAMFILGAIVVFSIVAIFNYLRFNDKVIESVFTQPMDVQSFGDIVIAKGSWVSGDTNDTMYGNDQVNSVSITCYQAEQYCEEIKAQLSISYSSDYIHLIENKNTYEIKEWDENHIKAVLTGLGQIFEININLRDKSANFVARDNPSNATAGDTVRTAQLKDRK